jgi:plasmid stabilization system protein ParE
MTCPLYELTEGAAPDIHAIARYTVTTWGIEQAHSYEVMLESHFQAMGREKDRTRIFLKDRPMLRVSRIKHHYVFHLVREISMCTDSHGVP